jgi:hypothetical protein
MCKQDTPSLSRWKTTSFSEGISDIPYQWPRDLRRGSAVARLLGLQVRIPPEAWISVFVLCVVR